MMQHGHWNPHHMHHAQYGCNQMRPSHHIQPIVCPTQYRCHDQFIPREVPVIHPIVNVNRQNTVVVPRDYYVETTRNVPGETILAQPGFGPGYRGRRRRPWR